MGGWGNVGEGFQNNFSMNSGESPKLQEKKSDLFKIKAASNLTRNRKRHIPRRVTHPRPHSPWNFRELSSLGQSARVKTSPGLDACSEALWLWPPLPHKEKQGFTYVLFSLREKRGKSTFTPSCRRGAPEAADEWGFPPLPTGSPQFFLSLWANRRGLPSQVWGLAGWQLPRPHPAA